MKIDLSEAEAIIGLFAIAYGEGMGYPLDCALAKRCLREFPSLREKEGWAYIIEVIDEEEVADE